MIRIVGWEDALNECVHRHMKLPSQYGTSDCYLICDDTVFAMTGERMYDGVVYESELQAAKELLKRGFENVEQAFAAKFEEIPTLQAQRGDIGVVLSGGQLCGGVFTAIGFMVRDAEQIVFLPVTQVKTAFKVAR